AGRARQRWPGKQPEIRRDRHTSDRRVARLGEVNEPKLADPERYQHALEVSERSPLPARVQNIVFATAGWTDKSLIKGGIFYPKGTNDSESRLRYYAAHFAAVEVDSTYYTLLPPSVAANWLAWTPQDFLFSIKAHPILTGHPIDVAKLPGDLREQC